MKLKNLIGETCGKVELRPYEQQYVLNVKLPLLSFVLLYVLTTLC